MTLDSLSIAYVWPTMILYSPYHLSKTNKIYLPSVTTLATTSTSVDGGEAGYCDDVTEHLYVNELSLTKAANLAILTVKTAF